MSEIVGLDSVLAIMGKICKTTQQRRLRIKLARSVKAKLHVAQFASELVSDLSTGVKLYVKAKQQSAPGRKEDVYLTEGYGAINSDSVRSKLYDALQRAMMARKVEVVIEVGTGGSAFLAKKWLDRGNHHNYIGIEVVDKSFEHARRHLSYCSYRGRVVLHLGQAQQSAPFLADALAALRTGKAEILSELVGTFASSEGYIQMLDDVLPKLQKDGASARCVPEMIATCFVPLNVGDNAAVLAAATASDVRVGTHLLMANRVPYERMLPAFIARSHGRVQSLLQAGAGVKPSLASSTAAWEAFDTQRPLGPQLRQVRLVEYACVGAPRTWHYMDAFGTFIVIGGASPSTSAADGAGTGTRCSRRLTGEQAAVGCGCPYNIPDVPQYSLVASSCASDPMSMTNWKNAVVWAPCRLRCRAGSSIFVETLSDQTTDERTYAIAVCVPKGGTSGAAGCGWTAGVPTWASNDFKARAATMESFWLEVTELHADFDKLQHAQGKAAQAAILADYWPKH